MARSIGEDAQPMASVPTADRSAPADHLLSELGNLLQELDGTPYVPEAPRPVISPQADNQLVQVRLGAASSLFTALGCKHAATATHALRVALTCSGWALKMGLEASQRDLIEISALLHDVGVIGVPDHILSKPGLLNSEEANVLARTRQVSIEILRQSCTSSEMLDIVDHVRAWYDGGRRGFRLSGRDIPLGARMIAIVEAFDAMTSDHPHRPAMPRERAMIELFDCTGTQFDPELVKQFVAFCECNQSELHREIAGRWLKFLDWDLANSHWQLNPGNAASKGRTKIDAFFQSKLLDSMYDAVVFVDAVERIILWNNGAERLTGITSGSVVQRLWTPELLRLCDEKGRKIDSPDCPVGCAIRSGVQSLRRLTICGRTGRSITVDSHTIPVTAEDGSMLGVILLFHDASSETSLEQRCQNLQEKSIKDPLTQVANRAEFDRVHELFVAAHQQQHLPCSLIIGDLDHFKVVNDTFGHQAGDEVIKSLASLLKSSCRPGDLVARYGGEEFVLLYADCNSTAATRRAEGIRIKLAQLPHPQLGGRAVTVSFGVTEIQPGDTPETMLRRADRALLMAKARGRDNVVQLGTGSGSDEADSTADSSSLVKDRRGQLLEQVLVTSVPIKMAVEKLRGFVSDHQARILQIDGSQIRLEINEKRQGRLRRFTDRAVTFGVVLLLEEERFPKDLQDPSQSEVLRTKIRISISPRRNRDRRRRDVANRAKSVLASFRSYLMATEDQPTEAEDMPPEGEPILAP